MEPQLTPTWTRSEDKVFENSLVRYPEGTPNRWCLIALQVPGKSPDDVRVHYQALVQDIEAIDCGAVELPEYEDDEDDDGFSPRIAFGSKTKREERKRGTPWTEDEHM